MAATAWAETATATATAATVTHAELAASVRPAMQTAARAIQMQTAAIRIVILLLKSAASPRPLPRVLTRPFVREHTHSDVDGLRSQAVAFARRTVGAGVWRANYMAISAWASRTYGAVAAV